uniref:Uncharacterized protein n=1 Tax=Opuntia streptacantha TaxID=393608 RepID=A0A7C9A749_OPUST
MPTFSAIALDRLLDPGASNSLTPAKDKDNSDPSARLNTTSNDFRSSSKRLDIPPPHPGRIHRSNTVAAPPEKKIPVRPQMSPALYATPASTPLPDCPTSSFPPSSPYIINHKRRGPRLMKSFSEKNVAAAKKEDGEDEAESKPINGHSRSFSEEIMSKEDGFNDEVVNGHLLRDAEVENRSSNGHIAAQKVEIGGSNGELGDEIENGKPKGVNGSCSERDGGESEDFFDPQESMSCTSNTDGDDCSTANKLSSSMGEFFDAAEELSSDSGRQSQRSLADAELELREMRLSVLMEIERRKQAEEAAAIMRSQWQILREKLGSVGLILPADLSALLEDSHPDIDPTEDICRQIHLARFVSESIGRGIAKAEAEAEMEAQLEMKNFEIARLSDRLNYYEAMNREMSQRNQEAIEVARSQRQKRRRRQKWVWGSIAAAITIGSAALAWSYMPSGRGSSSSPSLEASETDSNLQ